MAGASAGPLLPGLLGPGVRDVGPLGNRGAVGPSSHPLFGWSVHESYGACRAGLNKKSGWPLDFLGQLLATSSVAFVAQVSRLFGPSYSHGRGRPDFVSVVVVAWLVGAFSFLKVGFSWRVGDQFGLVLARLRSGLPCYGVHLRRPCVRLRHRVDRRTFGASRGPARGDGPFGSQAEPSGCV